VAILIVLRQNYKSSCGHDLKEVFAGHLGLTRLVKAREHMENGSVEGTTIPAKTLSMASVAVLGTARRRTSVVGGRRRTPSRSRSRR
jgi:hypothetical protein